jgi:hypothetical protein
VGTGSIYAEFGRRSWRQNLEFLADRGDIRVTAPRDAKMMIEVETSNGKIASDFGGPPIQLVGGGQKIVSRTGEGGGMLTIRTGRGVAELFGGHLALVERSSMQPVNSSSDPKPNPNPGYDLNPNPDSDSDSNTNPLSDADANPYPEIDAENARDFGDTGEKLPVSVPAGVFRQFSDATIRGWPDARVIARLRDIAATHVKKHPNDYVRERSEWALTLVRNGEVVAPLRAALSSADWRERAYAAWVLAATQDPRATDALTAALGDSHWRVRMHAAAGLERNAGAAAVTPLINALKDEYWQVRIAAVSALGAIGDRRALPSLAAVAERDARSIVRDEARVVVDRLK